MTGEETITPDELIAIADDQTWYDGGSALWDIREVLRIAAATIRRAQDQPRPLANFTTPAPAPKRRT